MRSCALLTLDPCPPCRREPRLLSPGHRDKALLGQLGSRLHIPQTLACDQAYGLDLAELCSNGGLAVQAHFRLRGEYQWAKYALDPAAV